MGLKGMEGQLDFLGLINEYTDDQGAVVRIREPKARRSKPIPPPEPEQLVFDFEIESCDMTIQNSEPQLQEEVNRQTNATLKGEEIAVAEAQFSIESKAKEESKQVVDEKTTEKAEIAEEAVVENKPVKREILFKSCKRCWCFDCKHNSKNEAVPRQMCGMMMACPACDGCIEEDSATICEIGNAKEGCMTRAIEEGIVVPEEMEID